MSAPTPVVPLGKRVLVRKIESDRVAGIIIPKGEGAEVEAQRAEIVAVGKKSEFYAETCAERMGGRPCDECLIAGDVIYIAKFAGFKMDLPDGSALHAVNDEHVLGVEPRAEDGLECPECHCVGIGIEAHYGFCKLAPSLSEGSQL